ncbi:MAG: excinuclease ABC subunit UvrC [Patescibacteria group bacterium]|nr:excinuclease ABC subunit UvrC [Patescibacteria group bacterium]
MQEKIKSLPKTPGVYLFRDKTGKALYVGKAVDLRNRVQSYFQESAKLGSKTQLMVSQIGKIEHFETESEFTALLLEADLIKHLKPKYNQRFKDDKSYPLIEITKEKYPRVRITRKKRENAEYFGPYPHGNIRKVLKLLRKPFPFRDCSNRKFTRYKKRGRGCLFADMDLCSAPCAEEMITEEEYRNSLTSLKNFLRGKGNSVIRNLEKEMKKLSREKNFKEAAKVRDQLDNLRYIRCGFRTATTEELDINLTEDRQRNEMKSLKSALGMENLPQRIEAYDISNIQGKQATGSMVVFENARPKKSHYRKFKIRSREEPDDVGMMQEVLERRFSRINNRKKAKDKSFQSVPDLILIDGGKGQLNAALEVLEHKELNIPAASIAKKEEEVYFSGDLSFDNKCGSFIIEGPITLSRNSPALKLLQRVRDESHRFALAYHRKLRSKNL